MLWAGTGHQDTQLGVIPWWIQTPAALQPPQRLLWLPELSRAAGALGQGSTLQRQQENTFPPGHQVILPRGSLTCPASPRAHLCPVPPARAVPTGKSCLDTAQCHCLAPAGPLQGPALPGDDSGTQAWVVLHLQGQGWGCCQPGCLLVPGPAWLFGAPQGCHQPLLGTGNPRGSDAARGGCSEPVSVPRGSRRVRCCSWRMF